MNMSGIDSKKKDKLDKGNSFKLNKLAYNEKNLFVQLTEELIKEMTNEDNLALITSLNFHMKLKSDSKIKKIEGLTRLINLEELNLSYQLINKIEGIDNLIKLKDLNLAENNIKIIENIENLKNLERLNLNGNMITFIPESIKNLIRLNTLKISRNRLEGPDNITNLRHLISLKNLTISENPLSKSSGYMELCVYINDQIETVDSKRITYEQKKNAEKLFSFDKEDVNNQIVENKQNENQYLRDLNKELNLAKTKLLEENHNLKRRIEELESDLKAANDLIDEKNHELSLKIERITELEHEVSQYKIDFLYQKLGNLNKTENLPTPKDSFGFGNNFNGLNTNQLSGNARDELLRLDKVISAFTQEKKELMAKLEAIQAQKGNIIVDLEQRQEVLANYDGEIKTLEQKLKQTTRDHKNELLLLREKEEKVNIIHSQTEKLREQSLELQAKISKIKDKINKTSILLQGLDPDTDQDDIVLVQNKFLKLNEKLNLYERSNDEIIKIIAGSNRQLQELSLQIDSFQQDRLNSSNHLSSRTNKSVDDIKEIIDSQYEKVLQDFETYKKITFDLNDKKQKLDLQINFITKQIESFDQKISEAERGRLAIENNYKQQQQHQQQQQPNSITSRFYNSTNSEGNLYTEKYIEKSPIQQGPEANINNSSNNLNATKGILYNIMALMRIFKNMYNVYNKKKNIKGTKLEMNIKAIDELIQGIEVIGSSGSNSNSSGNVSSKIDNKKLENILEKFVMYNEAFNEKFENYINQLIKEEENYDQRIKAIEDRITEKKKLEEELMNEINKKEKVLDSFVNELNKYKDDRNTFFEEMKILYKQVITNKRKGVLLTEGANLDDMVSLNDKALLEAENGNIEVEYILKFFNKLLKILQKNFQKMDEFNSAKAQFIEEFEKETKELTTKWRELDTKKSEFKTKLLNELDEHKKLIKNEYDKLEKDKQKWYDERRRMDMDKSRILDDYHLTIKDKDIMTDELRKDKEQKEILKSNFDNQISSLKKQLEGLKTSIQEHETQKYKLKQEYAELQRLSELEFRRHNEIKEETDKLSQSYNGLYTENEALQTKVQKLREEELNLHNRCNEIKNQINDIEEEFKIVLEKYKSDEKSLKKTIETLTIETEAKKRLCKELNEKSNLLAEDINIKQRDLSNIESLVEEFNAEKDVYRKNKLENAQLEREIEENRLRLEEMKYKANLQEESLNSFKKQVDSTNNLLKEKQLELFNLDKKVAKSMEILEENQTSFDKYDQIINSKREDLSKIETMKIETLKEIEKLNKKVMEFDELIQAKEGKIQSLNNEYSQKLNELNELNEMINDNDSKYKKIIKDNKDTFDQVLKDLRNKEEEYHELSMQVDQLTQKKSGLQTSLDSMEREFKLKDEVLKRILANLENTQNEIKRLSNDILELTDKETNLEYNITRLKDNEAVLSVRYHEIKENVEKLSKIEDELQTKIKTLQVKEDSIYVLMALNGEKVTEKFQRRIKEMVLNHFEIKELKKKIEEINAENMSLSEELKKYTIPSTNKKSNITQTNLNLKFEKENIEGMSSSMSNIDGQNLAYCYTDKRPGYNIMTNTQSMNHNQNFSKLLGKPSPMGSSQLDQGYILSKDNYVLMDECDSGKKNTDHLEGENFINNSTQNEDVKRLLNQIEDNTRDIKNIGHNALKYSMNDKSNSDDNESGNDNDENNVRDNRDQLQGYAENVTLGDLM